MSIINPRNLLGDFCFFNLFGIVVKMSVITHKQFKNIRSKHGNKVIVYVSGTFDLTHPNHIIFFEKAKKFGDILVVGVGPDKDVKNNKARETVFNQHMRMKMVDSLKPVDYCFLGKEMLKNKHPQTRVLEIFKELRPDIYYLNNDVGDIDFRKQTCQENGIKMVISKPSKKYGGLTATKIVAKITDLLKNKL